MIATILRKLPALLACGAMTHAQTVQITSPANGTIFNPGQTITVTVSASGGFSSVFIGAGSLGISAPLSAPPYQFSLPVRASATQEPYTITAIGVLASGQLVNSTPITIVVQRPDSPVRLQVQPSTLFDFNIGETAGLGVMGTYSDGTLGDLTHAASTTYVSNNPAIATVNSQGIVTAVAQGSTYILVNGIARVPVTVAPAMRIAPLKIALYASKSQQFFPRLSTNASLAQVTWSLNPAVGTVSSSGVYTAPSQIASKQTVLITATLTSNSAITATATITLLPPVAVHRAPPAVH